MTRWWRRSQNRPIVRAKSTSPRLQRLEDRITPAAFTPGDLVIYRVGDGAAGLSSAAQAVFLDEYTPAGVLVQSVAMPTTADGANLRLTASGTATSEGLLTRSVDGRFLMVPGYDAATGTASISGTTSASVSRVIGRVDANAAIDTTTGLNTFNTGNIRSVTSTDGSDIWATGSNTGVVYTTFGSTGTSFTVVSTTLTNLRQTDIFAGQLYVSTASGSSVRIGTVGTGTPTTSGQTIANLPGLPTSGTGSLTSPYAFFFADLDAGVPGVDTLYVADDSAPALAKYSLVGGNWVTNGAVGVDQDNYRGVTATVDGTTVTLYAIRQGGAGATGGGEFVKIVDSTGYNADITATPTILATAAANTSFRGIALTPEAPAAVSAVTSTAENGTYKVGDAIPITVTFTTAVTVTGTPQLTLATAGTVNEVVDYASGTGTDTLTFTYTVQAGETSADLDYLSADALTLNGGTIADAAGNDAVLTLPDPGAADSLGANKDIIVDGIAPTVDDVTSPSANGAYKTGDTIAITVQFGEVVTVTGAPQLTLETGATDAVVDYTSGSGSTTLTFTYTVAAGDTSVDLDYLSPTALALNGGTITDAAGNDAVLTLADPGAAGSLSANKDIVIDTTAPAVTTVSSTAANGTYKVGDTIAITVQFSEVVTVAGTPQLTLETGPTDAVASYSSGSGTDTLTFTYTVAAGNSSADLDYVSSTALGLNGGTITDGAGNDAVLTLPDPGTAGSLGANADIVIDGIAPTVADVSSATANGTYKVGDTITVTIQFNDAVTVTGTPQLTLETGPTDEVASYANGTGTDSLTFTYTVQAGDTSGDLDYLSADALSLNGGTITDAAGNDAVLTLPDPGTAGSLGANADIVIDGIAPTVADVSSATANGTYKVGDTITVTIQFNDAVTVTGTPQLTLETGPTDEVASFASGAGTDSLTFTYTVQAGDTSADLDYLSADALSLNGGTITDAAGNDAVLTLPEPGAADSLGANKDIIVDGIAPAVDDVTSPAANGAYKAGDTIAITVQFGEAVTVTGTPQLTLETGATDAVADYTSGSGTDTLTFTYTVSAGDSTSDLNYVSSAALALNGGSISDAAGNDAVLTLPEPGAAGSLGANSDIIIDGIAPTVSTVSSTTANGTYKVGDSIAVTVQFSEIVTVTGTPQLTLETGPTDAVADYTSGSGSTTLTFTYTVAEGDTSADLDYFSSSALALNGGTIADAAGNDAVLTLADPGAASSLGANKDIVIDTTAPAVATVSSTAANGTYKVGDTIAITVQFSEAVTVTGTPQLTLETGPTDAVASYSSGSGTDTLTFTYTVAAGNSSADLDYVSSTALGLNGGTITDGAGNDAVLTLPDPGTAGSLGANADIVIDGIAPTVADVSSATANGTYKVGDTITVTIQFNDAVTVTGTPQLTLETGPTDEVASYANGTGTDSLTFTYTVQAGDTSGDLDYLSADALSLNGGTITDAAGNDAVLTLPDPGTAGSLGANADIVIDGIAPTVADVSSATANGTYKVGDTITVTIQFNDAVTVTGTPQLTLETGPTDEVASYANGTGTDSLTFTYTVQAGDTSGDLDYLSADALSLNGGTITDAAGNDAVLTLPEPGAADSLGANKDIIVDGIAPAVDDVTSPAANGAYKAGDTIAITVQFGEAVTVTGTPQLTLETGATDAVADYTSGSGTDTLTFTYTVSAGDSTSDLNYVSSAALALNGGSISDAAGNDAVLTLPEPGAAGSLGANSDIIIDGIAPTVSTVSSTTANGTYKVGDSIAVTVQFSEIVTVTGTPQLTLETGPTDAVVNYTSGSGSTTLTFTYTVAAGDTSADLDYFSSSALALNGGTIADVAGNDAVLTLADPGAASSLGANKDIVIDTTAPAVTTVSSTAANGTYIVGDTIAVTVQFSEALTVTGTPQLTLETGTTDAVVNYTSGSGTDTLTFTYTVAAGDTSADLDYISSTALALNDGTITDAAGNDAVLTLPEPGAAGSLGANADIIIDGIAPGVSTVSSTTANGTYKIGDTITVTVEFGEAVTVNGTPQLTLETGPTDAVVNYTSGSGTGTLTFTYTVIAGDTTADLDYLSADALSLNGGTITDGSGNDAVLTLPDPGAAGSLGANTDIVIDGIAPTVAAVTSPTANGTYKVGDTITVTIQFNDAVTVTGTPQLTLETGTTDAVVNYTSGSGTGTLTFTYTVIAGDTTADLDYLSPTALALNGGTITDAAGNDAVLTLADPGSADSLGANKDIVIDTTAPAVATVSSTAANGTYRVGDTIAITVQFSEAVTVTGTPQLTLETGTTDAVVNYTSGSGTGTLTFTYTVAAGDSTSDLDYVSATALAFNGGTITDAAGNVAVLTLASPGAAGSLGANKDVVIDGIAPTVSNVTSPAANGTYKVGDVIAVAIQFSEAVTVTGTPQLTLETGATDAVVNYTSGSGTATLTFTYTVAAGQTATDLDYISSTALAFNGGAITDAAGNTAVLTLPAPGTAGSLSANKDIVIDGIAPTVADVSSTSADGTYKIGDTITVTMQFGEAVTVTGTPQLTLETGPTDAVVDYTSGSGTTTLTFTYTVAAGHTSADLDYVSATALALSGGAIADAAGNNAVLNLAAPGSPGSLSVNKDIVVDGVVPTVANVTSPTANGTYRVGDAIAVTVQFSEAVTVSGTPQFTLETGATDAIVNYASGSGTTTLTFIYTVAVGDSSADLDYVSSAALALNGGTIKDAAGNAADLTLAGPGGAGSLGENKDIVVDGVAPVVSSVSSTAANGTYKIGDAIPITVQFSEAVTVTGTPQLTLETGAADAVVSYSSGSGTNTLTFTYIVAAGQSTGDLDYLSSSALALNGGTITDAAGNNAALILAAPGAAGSLGANKGIAIDGVAPTVTNVTSSTANGAYKAGDTVVVTVQVSEAVTVTGTPRLTLETGASDAVVSFTGGSGTNTLAFTYTIAAGQTSPDVDYVSSTALTLNGGTIKDAAGNNAGLTLPSPGTPGSLGGNKNIVIDTSAPTVTINQAAGQTDPASGLAIQFTVVFSEPVTGLDGGDIMLAGSAGATTAAISGTGPTYTVTVTGMTHTGTVTATVVAGAAHDPAGNLNAGSTSTDNTVTFTGTAGGHLLAVGAGAGGGPHVKVYNPDGSLRFSFYAYDATFAGGVNVATGDVNDDGVTDIITGPGAGMAPWVKVYSGVDGSLMRSFLAYGAGFGGGVFVAAGDINHDGKADIITGAGPTGGPHVKVFSGADNSELRSFYAYAASFAGGVRVAAGDVNGDLMADIVTGAGPGGGPHVKVISGADNSELRSFYAYAANFSGGVYVAAGDLNGDGQAEVVTGPGQGGGPHVRAFDGADGSLYREFMAFSPSDASGARVAVSDADGDGQLDLAVASGAGKPPAVQIFNPRTLALVRTFNAFDPGFFGGVDVGGV